MSVSLPNGALVAIASAYTTAKVITSISNANPAVMAMAAGHGFVTGDLLEMTSGWSRLTNRIVRAGVVASDNVPIDGYDSSSTTIYPTGGGGGSARKITGFTQLAQILNSASSGGVQQFQTYQFLEGDSQLRIPTFKDAQGLTFDIADDPTLPGYILASAANDDRLPRAVRISLPSGSSLLYNAYISLNKTPSLTVNTIMGVQATLSLLAEPVRYAS